MFYPHQSPVYYLFSKGSICCYLHNFFPTCQNLKDIAWLQFSLLRVFYECTYYRQLNFRKRYNNITIKHEPIKITEYQFNM